MRPESYKSVEKSCSNCSFSSFDERDYNLQCTHGENEGTLHNWKHKDMPHKWLVDFWKRCRVAPDDVCDEFEEQ